MGDRANWSDKTLTQLENHDWGEPTFPSFVVTNGHRLRYKPLREFTVGDLRFMLGQRMSFAVLVPMAIDVLETEPFAKDEMYGGLLLSTALSVEPMFWKQNERLWSRMHEVIVELRALKDELDQEILPAAHNFERIWCNKE